MARILMANSPGNELAQKRKGSVPVFVRLVAGICQQILPVGILSVLQNLSSAAPTLPAVVCK